jgi:flavin-dependent dehydrogenase
VVEILPASVTDICDMGDAPIFPETGRTMWWESDEPVIEDYAGPQRRCQIERTELDRILLDNARKAGVHVLRNTHAPSFDLSSSRVTHDSGTTEARFIVDATGRTGLLVRQIRRFWDDRYTTIGVCRILRGADLQGVDPNHTLVEAFDTGWGWSVPFADGLRYVCLMVDAMDARTGVEGAYKGALEGAVHLRKMFRNARPEGPVFGRDASLYYAERYAGRNWILIGDAASFSDPVASFGLERALRSAQAGAATVHACLSDTSAAEAEADRYDAAQRRAYLELQNEAKRRFAQAAGRFPGAPFWETRAAG